MPFEKIQVIANGVAYEGWESCTIINAVDEAWATAQLITTEVGGIKDKLNPSFTQWDFPPGTPVQIMANGDLVFTGVVNVYSPTVTEDQHTITVTVTTYGRYFVDTSVNHPTGFFENMTDTAIVGQFAALAGVPLSIFSQGMIIPYWQIRYGASNWQEAMRILQQRGKMLWSRAATGDMVITDGNPFGLVTGGAILEGVNVLRETATLTDQMWSLVFVGGQSSDGVDEKIHLQPMGTAMSSFRMPPRYKRIIDQASTNAQLAQIRANWEMHRSEAGAMQATFTLPGWRENGATGKIWEPNWDVYCKAPWLKIDCVLRILKVVLNQDSNLGTTAMITVVDGQGIGGEISQCNSGSLWDMFKFKSGK